MVQLERQKLYENRTTDDVAFQSGDVANISEHDISLPLSPATMCITLVVVVIYVVSQWPHVVHSLQSI